MDATLEVPLDEDFLAAADAAQRPPSAIIADLMKEFVERERGSYTEFLHRKVERARQSASEGHWAVNDEVERKFAARRQALSKLGDDSGP